jgi:hypothetical protein
VERDLTIDVAPAEADASEHFVQCCGGVELALVGDGRGERGGDALSEHW